MAVQYAPMKLRVPPGFQNLLEGLAREVLREQPEDIIVFAAQYFKNQLQIRDGKLTLLLLSALLLKLFSKHFFKQRGRFFGVGKL